MSGDCIYKPSEDSYFFADFLRKYLGRIPEKEREKIKYLDLGCGSGILAETAVEFLNKKNILTSDINPDAVKLSERKGFNAVLSDLFDNINEKFDIITFNAPYLPEDEYDKEKDTSGGKKGDETAVEFLKQSGKFLVKNGKVFLLVSSLTPLRRIRRFNVKIEERKRIFFEEFFILQKTEK